MKATWYTLWASFNTHIKLTLTRPTFQITLVAQPVVMATIAYMVYRRIGDEGGFSPFVALGAGIAGMWSSTAFSSAGDVNRERFYGTLPTLLGSPSPLAVVMMGKVMANATLCTFSLAISLAFSLFILGVSPGISNPLAFGLALLDFQFATSLFALAMSGMFLLSRSTAVLQNFLEYPLMIVSGVFFPLEILPEWLRPAGWLTPLYWGSEAMRRAIEAPLNAGEYWRVLGIEGGFGLFFFALVLAIFRYVGRRVRIGSDLDVY